MWKNYLVLSIAEHHWQIGALVSEWKHIAAARMQNVECLPYDIRRQSHMDIIFVFPLLPCSVTVVRLVNSQPFHMRNLIPLSACDHVIKIICASPTAPHCICILLIIRIAAGLSENHISIISQFTDCRVS